MVKSQLLHTWIALADSRRGQLLRCSLTPKSSRHIELMENIKSQWPGHQRGRPSPRMGKFGHSYASQGHESEEDLQRFAKTYLQWVRQKMQAHNIDHLTVYAPPRCLGALRQVCPKSMHSQLDLREGDLLNLSHEVLTNHKLIRQLVELTSLSKHWTAAD